MKDQINALLDKARRYLHSAELLQAAGDYDSAASRLYYAMFYCAEALLITKGMTFSSHRGVISAFGQYLVKPGELPVEMHRWRQEAFDKRQTGDYMSLPALVLNAGDVQTLYPKAEAFIHRTEAFLQQGGFL